MALSRNSPQVLGWNCRSLLTISVSKAFGSNELNLGAEIPKIGLVFDSPSRIKYL